MGKTLALAPFSCEAIISNVMMLYLKFAKQEDLEIAFNVLREGGQGSDEMRSDPWSKSNASVTDKYGVNWWLHI